MYKHTESFCHHMNPVSNGISCESHVCRLASISKETKRMSHEIENCHRHIEIYSPCNRMSCSYVKSSNSHQFSFTLKT